MTPTPWATLTPLATPNPFATQAIDLSSLAGADITMAETIVQRYNQFNYTGALDAFMWFLIVALVIFGLWSILKRLQGMPDNG